MKCANENGFSIVRFLQKDVYPLASTIFYDVVNSMIKIIFYKRLW
jgi:hypothetical protein